ncbi:MAG TPA: chemotaxis protein CheW [Polyangiaceae bacterium]|jgi:purine-binding chemotaxis protein CheW|nr:chemotaxis protein CheW [Polyangiaceae bacterium]
MSVLHVLFKVADAEYVVPAADVVQMESFTTATFVPGTRAHVAGLVQVRGQVVPVIDVRMRFNLPKLEPTLDSRVVIVKDGPRTVALLVDAAREVVHIPPSDFHPPPEVVSRQSKGFVKSVATSGNRLVMLVDFQKIIGEEPIHAE